MNPIVKRGIVSVRADADIKTVLADLGKAFHEFKAENDVRLKEIQAKGTADPLLNEKVDKINAAVTEFANFKAEFEKLQDVVARGNYGGGEGVDPAIAEHTKAFEKFFRKGTEAGLVDLEVKADLRTNSDPDGGYTIPVEYERSIERVALTISAMRRLANKMTIGTSSYEKLVNLGGASSGWVGETQARPKTDTPTLAKIILNTKEVYANPAITQQALDDSRINIAQWLADEVVIEFDQQEAEAFIYGNGVERPQGILAYPTVANASYAWGKVGYIASTEAAALTKTDQLIAFQHSLKSQYRNGASFLMSDATLEALRKLKYTVVTDEYIWRPGLSEGVPSTILGKPYEIDDNMPSIGAGKFPIALANWKRAYLIIDRTGIRVLRDPFTNKPYVQFYTTKRVGGGLTNYEAIKLLKVAAS